MEIAPLFLQCYFSTPQHQPLLKAAQHIALLQIRSLSKNTNQVLFNADGIFHRSESIDLRKILLNSTIQPQMLLFGFSNNSSCFFKEYFFSNVLTFTHFGTTVLIALVVYVGLPMTVRVLSTTYARTALGTLQYFIEVELLPSPLSFCSSL